MFSVHFNVVLLYHSLKIGSFYNNGPNLNRCMPSLCYGGKQCFKDCSALLITFKSEKDVLTHNFIGDWACLTTLSLWALHYYFGAEPRCLWKPETHLSLQQWGEMHLKFWVWAETDKNARHSECGLYPRSLQLGRRRRPRMKRHFWRVRTGFCKSWQKTIYGRITWRAWSYKKTPEPQLDLSKSDSMSVEPQELDFLKTRSSGDSDAHKFEEHLGSPFPPLLYVYNSQQKCIYMISKNIFVGGIKFQWGTCILMGLAFRGVVVMPLGFTILCVQTADLSFILAKFSQQTFKYWLTICYVAGIVLGSEGTRKYKKNVYPQGMHSLSIAAILPMTYHGSDVRQLSGVGCHQVAEPGLHFELLNLLVQGSFEPTFCLFKWNDALSLRK